MKIVLAAFGSLGDMHPMIALGIELRRRGHAVAFAAMEFYREKIELLGFEFRPMRPHLDPNNKELARQLMDAKNGSELILRELILPNLRPMYEDLTEAVHDADLFISTEVVFRREIGPRKNRREMDYDDARARNFSFGVRSVRAADGAVAQASAFSRQNRFTARCIESGAAND